MHRRFASKALACLAMAFAVALSAPANAAPEALLALNVCPSAGPHAACLRTGVAPGGPERCDEDHRCEDYPTPAFFTVSGVLDGAPAGTYRLRLERSPHDRWTMNSPEVAYLGQSPRGRPIVLTDQGPLEILTAKFAPGRQGFAFMDARTWKVLDMAFLATSSGETVVTSLDDIGVWDDERQLCVSGLVPKRELLRIIANGCRARANAPPEPGSAEDLALKEARASAFPRDTLRWLAAWYAAQYTGLTVDQIIAINTPTKPTPPRDNQFGNVEPFPVARWRVRKLFPNDYDEEMAVWGEVSPHFGGGGHGISFDRINGSHILIVTVVFDDC